MKNRDRIRALRRGYKLDKTHVKIRKIKHIFCPSPSNLQTYLPPTNVLQLYLLLNAASYTQIFGGKIISMEALESVMCDVIKIRLKRRIATRSGKGKQPLNIKTAVERPILKLGLPNFSKSFYFILLLVTCLLYRLISMTSHMTLPSALIPMSYPRNPECAQ